MLRTFALSVCVFTMTTGSLWALEAKRVDDVVLLRAVVNNDSIDPVPVLECDPPLNSNPSGGSFYEVPLEGPGSLTKYVVPKRHALVVTSFQWVSEDDDPSNGDPTAHQVHIAGFSAVLDGTVNGRSTVAPSMISDAYGGAGGSVVIPTGVVIPGGATICMQVGASQGFLGEALGFLQGYLVKGKK